MTQWVYGFDEPGGAGDDRAALLGGKGAGLAEMSALGLPVPPGFTLTTEVCAYFLAHDGRYPPDLSRQVAAALARLEAAAGSRFGHRDRPLLVAVRSGGRESMPGMMDTVLNLGLNDETAAGLAAWSGDAGFAYDSYRRFIHGYGNVVLGLDPALFEEALAAFRRDRDIDCDAALDAAASRDLAQAYKSVVRAARGAAFPQDPHEQLWGAIDAVFRSWAAPRAVSYRDLCGVPGGTGTAVTVQAMVFGNMGERSGSGAACTRDPSTGENCVYGEFVANGQGGDVAAGTGRPQPLLAAELGRSGFGRPAMAQAMPDVFARLEAVRQRLEAHYRDMQDIEFTVQQGTLYILQTRSGKRTAAAGLRIAVDLAEAGVITRNEALLRIRPDSLEQLLRPSVSASCDRAVIAAGLPASPGAASGCAAFTPEAAERLAGAGKAAILVRAETSPHDIRGIHAARGVLTVRGGRNSHAAAVARAMGRACVTGAARIRIDGDAECFHADGVTVRAGDVITIDGATGRVMLGAAATISPVPSGEFETLMGWADDVREVDVRALARTEAEIAAARESGADGIGPLGAEGQELEAVFEHLSGLPVALRLAVPESVQAGDAATGGKSALAEDTGSVERQAWAIFSAIAAVVGRTGETVAPELLLPAEVGDAAFVRLKDLIDGVASDVRRERGVVVDYFVGRSRDGRLRDPLDGMASAAAFAVRGPDRPVFGVGCDDGAGLPVGCRASGLAGDTPFAPVAESSKEAFDCAGDGILATVCEAPGRSYIACSPSQVPAMRLAAAQMAIGPIRHS